MSPARPTRIPTPAEHFVGTGAWRHGLRYGLLGIFTYSAFNTA